MSAVEHLQIPEKLFYRITEVSNITEIKPYVLRYWETEFPMLSPEKDENDQRRYRRGDIELILEIKRLLYTERFTIAGARKKLREATEQANKTQPISIAQAPTMVQPQVQGPDVTGNDSERRQHLSQQLDTLRRDVEDLYRLLA